MKQEMTMHFLCLECCKIVAKILENSISSVTDTKDDPIKQM